MLNQTILVGRVLKGFTTITLNDVPIESELELSVQRAFKNENGEYETDCIPVVFNNALTGSTKDFVKEGVMIAVKGRIERTHHGLKVQAERISYLSAGKIDGQK